MNPNAAIFAIAILAGLALTPLVRAAGRQYGILDRPDGFREVHGRAVPLLGGIAIYGADALPEN